MYLYSKEHDLMSWHFNSSEDNKLCNACQEKQDKQELAECKEKHCGANTNRNR